MGKIQVRRNPAYDMTFVAELPLEDVSANLWGRLSAAANVDHAGANLPQQIEQ